jgi:hypothetical protein
VGLGCGYEIWDICLEMIMTSLRVWLVPLFCNIKAFL